MPLVELWDDTGSIAGGRIRYLDRNQIAELLRMAPVQFLVADCGLRLRWVGVEERFTFWRKVKQQIAEPEKRIYLKNFPDELAYIASEWRGRAGECLVVLEAYH